MDGKERRRKWERKYLLSGLIECHGHQEKTASYLGIASRTIRNWLKKYPDIWKGFYKDRPKRKDLK